MRLRVTVLAFGLAFGCGGAALANDFVGVWQTEGGKGQVRLSECGNRLCSEIVWLRESVDDRGRPLRDHNNPDPNLRNRPVVGLEILQGLTQSGRGEYAGHIYNPENGQTYRATIHLADRHTLRLRGCTSWGWPCGEQTWTRASERAPARQMARAGAAQAPQASQPRAADRHARTSEPASQPRASAPEQAPAPRQQSGERASTASLPPRQAAPSAGSQGYHVQIAARQSEEEAREAFEILQRRYSHLLGNYSPDIRMADLGPRGVWYRVRVGPLGERRSAEALCDRMKAAGGDCLVRNP